MSETNETRQSRPVECLVGRLREHALPDPHDEREVMHSPLLREAADEIERLRSQLAISTRGLKLGEKLMTEFSVARDPDGEPSLDIWLEGDNMVSLSLHPNGHISWAGVFDGTPTHGVVRNDPLGTLLFKLLDKAARLNPDDESVRRGTNAVPTSRAHPALGKSGR